MAGEEQICHWDDDFDDDSTEEIQKLGEGPIEEDVVEKRGSKVREEIDSKQQQSDEEVQESGSADLDDLALYEIKTKHYHVKRVTRRDCPQCLKRVRADVASSGEEMEEETPRKRRDVETETDVSSGDGQYREDDPDYRYYNDDEEEDSDLWSCCPFVAESLELEHFSKHFLPDSGLSLVKRRLSNSAVFTNKVVDLENQWKRLHKAEVALDLMRAELIQAQTKLVLQALY